MELDRKGAKQTGMNGIELYFPAGTCGDDPDPLLITPERAGLSYCGLRVVRLAPGESRTLATGNQEFALLPLAGGATVETGGRRFTLSGRASVFAAVSDWAYVPIDSELRMTSEGGCELALASARAERRFEPAYVPAEAVPLEIRGAGPATRQVVNFLAPGAFDAVDRLICVEVLTPDGNWSSYPPHKHDDSRESPVSNEEIYYFRVGKVGTQATGSEGFGIHRTYTGDGSIDATVVVRDGDAFLVPRGYHGPCIAAPGYPLYYLNVMAGAVPPRTMAIVDDPAHAWVRESWEQLQPDPRCPMIRPPERS
jgi:5-deoxy-glucuronate isomerase